jgi:hypothetical protein
MNLRFPKRERNPGSGDPLNTCKSYIRKWNKSPLPGREGNPGSGDPLKIDKSYIMSKIPLKLKNTPREFNP